MDKPVVFHLKRHYFDRIDFVLLRADDSKVIFAPIVSNGG